MEVKYLLVMTTTLSFKAELNLENMTLTALYKNLQASDAHQFQCMYINIQSTQRHIQTNVCVHVRVRVQQLNIIYFD